MTCDHIKEEEPGAEFDYLCVDDFIKSILDARSLATAFELRLIDYLIKTGEIDLEVVMAKFKGDSRGLRLLLDLLRANKVIEELDGRIGLTPRFKKALEYRHLLEAKIEFSNFAAHDFIDLFTDMITNPSRFMQKANMFKLFFYGRCREFNKENYDLTKRRMKYTTALTRYEAVRLHEPA